jgi:glycosidase
VLWTFFFDSLQIRGNIKRGHMREKETNTETAIAVRIGENFLDAEGSPRDVAWESAPLVHFSSDWQGRNPDAERETEVRLLWTSETLFLRFDARYRLLTVFPDAEPNGRRDQLWDRDVCEAFLQPEPSGRRYLEFEVAPNGYWIDLDIAPGEKHDLQSSLKRRVSVDENNKRWQAVLAVPMKSLTLRFDPTATWRANFYRVEGDTEPRFYSAWQPTRTPKPNFHVPEAFGKLVFTKSSGARDKTPKPRASVLRSLLVLLLFAMLSFNCLPLQTQAAQAAPATDNAPAVTKVEPPNWWIGVTPEVMLLLSGHNLQAIRVTCNLASLIVQRTQAAAGGSYLFVWLKITPGVKSGTAVCRVETPTGIASFELPLAARTETIHKFQGLAPDDVIYLIMPDRFANGDPSNDEPPEAPGSHDRMKPRAYHGGDLRGIRNHLSYLKDFGVTTLWLTPIVKNGATQDYHGYGAVDLYAVEPHLGSLRDFQELVATAHQQRMKVFFDIVPNHLGPRHPWAANPPLPDWFHGTAQQHTNSSSPLKGSFYGKTDSEAGGHDPFEAIVDPHAPPRLWRNLTEGWFVGILPDLNTENPVVAQYLLQNSVWWAESSGLDGYRVDTFPYVSRQFWSQWHAGLKRIYPRMATIGEVFHPDPSVTAFFAGGQKRYDGIDTGLATLFDYPMYFTLRAALLRGMPAGRMANILRHDWLYTRPDELVTFFGNHDVPRFASAEGSSPAKLKLAFGLALTLRGIPQLYYGDEIGMPGGADPDNRRDFPGGWPGDPQNAFTLAGRTAEQQEIFAYAQKLLQLRREHPALRGGRLWHLASDESSYVFARESEEERLMVVFNNAQEARELRISLADTPVHGATGAKPLFGEAAAQIAHSEARVTMPPQSLSIFTLN